MNCRPTHFGAIGSKDLPGLCKMTEENNEAGVEIGKIYGAGHDGKHWDGKGKLKKRLEDEMADQIAAISWFCHKNGYEIDQDRVNKKFQKFERWHENIQAGRDPNDDGDN